MVCQWVVIQNLRKGNLFLLLFVRTVRLGFLRGVPGIGAGHFPIVLIMFISMIGAATVPHPYYRVEWRVRRVALYILSV
ncbi:hypothetical protein HOY80DRAFT_949559 [Tuber brumale]|nr:hypothetical protein HOY80DRAFT_949559 [Tuber brumale]